MTTIKSKYNVLRNRKIVLERDENDPYYNIVKMSKMLNGKWKITKYYKYRTLYDAKKIFKRTKA